MNATADVAAPEPFEAAPGLAGVSVSRTGVSDVLGRKGFYHYRGYNAVDIARRGRVEDAWHLLLRGELPTAAQREAFARQTAELRQLPDGVSELLPALARLSRPGSLESLRSAVSVTGQAMGCQPWTDQTADETAEQAARFAAVMPTLAAQLFRLASGREPVQPRADLGYSDNYLYMITGEEPDDRSRYAVERYLMLTIDHGFNNSTFTSRVIASSGADLGAVVTGALGALSRPVPRRRAGQGVRHARRNRLAGQRRGLVAAGDHRRRQAHGLRPPGFTRPSTLARSCSTRSQRNCIVSGWSSPRRSRRTAVELLAELKPGRDLYANVEFYAGVVLEAAGLPREMFTANLRMQPGDRLDGERTGANPGQQDLPATGPLRRP